MKDKIKILGLAFMLIIGLGACEKAYLEPEKIDNKTAVVEEPKEMDRGGFEGDRITNGVWRITSFQWHLRDNNLRFKEYTFYFLPNRMVVAVHGNIKEYGRWERSNGIMRLSFGSLFPLRQLNNNKWYFIRESKDKFVLKGLNPIDSKSAVVEFERL